MTTSQLDAAIALVRRLQSNIYDMDARAALKKLNKRIRKTK